MLRLTRFNGVRRKSRSQKQGANSKKQASK